ncbi:MAG: glycosyltransferase [Methyloprofundus sp.]|nr:glycosyltransferase [Methyloprofundus sp.]
MMAKNVELYIADAITELQRENTIEWELIVVDDGSSDSTYEIVKSYAKNDSRIILKKNPYDGKVDGTSYAFSLSSGDIIKCIDSDDVLLRDWFIFTPNMQQYDAHCHAAFIVDEGLNKITTYNPNPKLIASSYEKVASELMSLPKWSWSFKRTIAEKVFPLPSCLPFEDVWMALLIKKHSSNILLLNEPLYLYRQHGFQTFGGITNFDREIVKFRSLRLLKLIDVLRNEIRVLSGSDLDSHSFDCVYAANALLSKDSVDLWSLVKLDSSISQKMKITLYMFLPRLTSYLLKLKWWFDAKKI